MHTNKNKAKVDFKFCMDNIPAMLRATKPVLSEKQYRLNEIQARAVQRSQQNRWLPRTETHHIQLR